MRQRILIVGGGTAGWLTAGYLAKRLSADLPGGVAITLVESRDIGVLGVGEGTFPTIRRTLATIGIDEAELVRRCGATFKQGIKFANWRNEPGEGATDHYLHPFQVADQSSGLELLPYWLIGAGGPEGWDAVATPQKKAADAWRAPKLASHADYVGPLSYAFHFDAIALAGLLRDQGIVNGVCHLVDTVTEVMLDEDGAIGGVRTEQHGMLDADLYIDCTGFRAELIGKAMGMPFRSCRDTLFCNRAVTAQLPYPDPNAPIASYTISTAQQAGWTWDIGLAARRGIGHVYSSDHSDDETAERVLRDYLGPASAETEVRRFKFDAGYREISWHKNCVAVGLSSGFFEPLEATGIAFAEVAAGLIANLFPWGGDHETSARQFNAALRRRYERALDFIKLHYCLSERRDTDFWRDNVAAASIPDSLQEMLDRWRFRWPNELDIDPRTEIFTEHSWQYVLYGMGWKTDLTARAGALRYHEDARRAFAEVRQQAQFAIRNLPSNRDLVHYAQGRRFGAQAAA
ncbi:tryptophan halogenase family protein [Sphingomonas prati]|uniref:Flavin-dependent dehydrogenase n=1 Tax=Sphingomonas prati TaxID=1843237 RepID=A0A7W9BQV3_9SPHN|nr:tryptophan halogenase family protein [Sphingomonas prati]MBB5728335.1 flavin-dependent dehydrogenase [Sphingomonas prati]GGE74592.1 tryptophan halogenase [Sphingomonas prati]